MAKFALPIKSTYVPSWGGWECVREFVQNAKDEEDGNHHKMVVSHDGETLTLINEGADMDRSVLLLGQTEKAGNDELRGQFGEGLNLALLAGVRAGFDITITTNTERWTPSLAPSDDFGGAECLTVTSRKLRKPRASVEVNISGITLGEWQAFERRFSFLYDFGENIVPTVCSGSVMLDPKFKGDIYSNGIWVANMPKFRYGYDLPRLTLDRDRRMVNVWSLQWDIGNLFREAMARRPDLLTRPLYELLRDDVEDIKGIGNHITSDVADELTKEFFAEQGEDAVAVESIRESQDVARVGKRGVVVPDGLRLMVQNSVGTVRDVVNSALACAKSTFSWTDLTPHEQAVLSRAAGLLDAVSGADCDVLGQVEVVEFGDPDLYGVCHMDDGKIQIARKTLDSVSNALTILVHEKAHANTGAGDGDADHVAEIERLWCKLWSQK